MAEQVLWMEIAKTVVTASVTIIVGLWVKNIQSSQRDIAKQQADNAYAQRKVAEAKLNLDLFEQRYEVFEKVWGFLSHATQDSTAQPNDLYADFTNLIPKAQFLFGKPIAKYMREAHEKRIELDSATRRVRMLGHVPPEDSRLLTDLHNWFFNEASNCFKRFADYLDFSAWKVDAVDRLLSPHAAVGC